jgi:hypothetical protein
MANAGSGVKTAPIAVPGPGPVPRNDPREPPTPDAPARAVPAGIGSGPILDRLAAGSILVAAPSTPHLESE